MSGNGGDKTPAPTAQERQLAITAARRYNRYATKYAGKGGVNEKFIAATRTTAGDREAVRGTVGADSAIIARTLDGQRAALTPSASGKAISTLADNNTSLASAAGRGKALATQAADDTQLEADFKLASFGQGLANDAQVGLSQATTRATNLVNVQAITKFKRSQALMEAAGTGIGMYAQSKDIFNKKKVVKPKAKSGFNAGGLGIPWQ